jgi:hypothetical protein
VTGTTVQDGDDPRAGGQRRPRDPRQAPS